MNRCWEYDGRIHPVNGYGYYGQRLVHRLAYEILVGPIPADKELDHLCRNRRCYNPDHLEPVDRRTNVKRGYDARGPISHCKRGHSLTDESNVYLWRNVRHCRACQMIAVRKYRGEV